MKNTVYVFWSSQECLPVIQPMSTQKANCQRRLYNQERSVRMVDHSRVRSSLRSNNQVSHLGCDQT